MTVWHLHIRVESHRPVHCHVIAADIQTLTRTYIIYSPTRIYLGLFLVFLDYNGAQLQVKCTLIKNLLCGLG